MIWPPYARDAVARGVITAREVEHLRANYGSKLAMIDHWLGEVLDAFDARGWWDDTALIVCTDHGHYLGEHDIVGKPGVPIYETMGHLPLFVAWPGVAPGRCDALTTTVDLHATLCDVFGVTPEHRTHGRSLAPLVTGEAAAIRDWAVLGVWGREVSVTDGHRTYARAPEGENAPLSMWSNRWSTMPVHAFPALRLPRPDQRAALDRMPGSDVPVIRQPFDAGDPLPFWATTRFDGNRLYDLDLDPAEQEDRTGEALEEELADLLRTALDELGAPDDQLVRLGLR
jgi:hypothetical protein